MPNDLLIRSKRNTYVITLSILPFWMISVIYFSLLPPIIIPPSNTLYGYTGITLSVGRAGDRSVVHSKHKQFVERTPPSVFDGLQWYLVYIINMNGRCARRVFGAYTSRRFRVICPWTQSVFLQHCAQLFNTVASLWSELLLQFFMETKCHKQAVL